MRVAMLLGVTASLAFSAPVFAADLGAVEPLPTPEAVAAEPANDWSGFYLGALLGYTWGDANTDTALGEIEAEGIDGGGYVGANWLLGNFVFGAEADVLASGLEGDEGGLDVDQGVNGSLRARAGIALDQFLLYGTGGVAATDVEVSAAGDSDDATLWGWTAGAGAEALLTDNITARVEYRYTDYEDETFTLNGGAGEGDLTTHSVRGGIGFKF
ncbi:MAG: porin family protein [Pseudomonadota bacterium]|nr:porin family protein [Pseudomonadota bacterium]